MFTNNASVLADDKPQAAHQPYFQEVIYRSPSTLSAVLHT
jgi:hypothetical protein